MIILQPAAPHRRITHSRLQSKNQNVFCAFGKEIGLDSASIGAWLGPFNGKAWLGDNDNQRVDLGHVSLRNKQVYVAGKDRFAFAHVGDQLHDTVLFQYWDFKLGPDFA